MGPPCRAQRWQQLVVTTRCNPAHVIGDTTFVVNERRVPVFALFALLVPLAFSDELVSAVIDIVNIWHRWEFTRRALANLVVYVDAVILVVVLASTSWFWRRSFSWPAFASATSGATLTLGIDLLDLSASRGRAPAWLDILMCLAWAAALAILVAGVTNTSPWLLVQRGRRTRWSAEWSRLRAIVPLLIGTLGAYLGIVWWEHALALPYDREALALLAESTSEKLEIAKLVVDKEFYAQLSQVIALLIVALGLEAGYFRNTRAGLSLSILCLGEVMALSALAVSGKITPWHAYLAFVIGVEACLIALSTLILVLVVRKETRPVHQSLQLQRQRRRLVPRMSVGPRPQGRGRVRRGLLARSS
jgi:hypothetical protein